LFYKTIVILAVWSATGELYLFFFAPEYQSGIDTFAPIV